MCIYARNGVKAHAELTTWQGSGVYASVKKAKDTDSHLGVWRSIRVSCSKMTMCCVLYFRECENTKNEKGEK